MLKIMERERNAAAGDDFLLGILLGTLATLHYYPCACFSFQQPAAKYLEAFPYTNRLFQV